MIVMLRVFTTLVVFFVMSSCQTPKNASSDEENATTTVDGDLEVTGGEKLPAIGGCTIFPADNPWNTDISGYPLHARSDDYVDRIGRTSPLHPDFGTFYEGIPNGMQYVVVPDDQPRVPITFTYATESDPGPYPIPDDIPIEASAGGAGDRHALIVQQGSCLLWEVFEAVRDGGSWRGGSGALFDLNSNALRPDGWTSADAAGLPILPGLVRYEEVEAGEIRHALRVTVPQTQSGYIHPATHEASNSNDPTFPPMGLRFRLKASVEIGGFTPRIQVILRALHTYGMFVADNGSAWYLSGVHNTQWSDNELRQLRSLTGNDFEAVETGPIR